MFTSVQVSRAQSKNLHHTSTSGERFHSSTPRLASRHVMSLSLSRFLFHTSRIHMHDKLSSNTI